MGYVLARYFEYRVEGTKKDRGTATIQALLRGDYRACGEKKRMFFLATYNRGFLCIPGRLQSRLRGGL